MQKPDYEFQLGKNISLRGVGWRGIVAIVVLFAGLALIGPALSGAISTVSILAKLSGSFGAK